MTVIPLLWLTILLQVTAGVLAFNLRFIRRQRWAWMLIGVGLILMSFRQARFFADYMSGTLELPPDPATELVALAISMIMLTGMVLMHQIARSEGRLTALVEKQIADLRAEVAERQRVGEALRRHEEQTRSIIDTAYDAFVRIDGAGRVT